MSEMLFGLHAVLAAVHQPLRSVYKVMLDRQRQDQRIKKLVSILNAKHIPIDWVDLSDIERYQPNQRHQGVLAFVSKANGYQERDIDLLYEQHGDNLFLLILDGITDPHNLGACLRTADGAGIHAVIIPKDKSVSLTAVVSKVACGAAEYIPLIEVTNLARCIDHLKSLGIWVYGAAGEVSEELYDFDYSSGPLAIALGREGEGLRRLVKEKVDFLFSIPMKGYVSSLNVSVAAAISLYEVVRQRKHRI